MYDSKKYIKHSIFHMIQFNTYYSITIDYKIDK